MAGHNLAWYKEQSRLSWEPKTAEQIRQKFGRYCACMGVVAALYLEKTGERLIPPVFSEMLRLYEGEALYWEKPKKHKKLGRPPKKRQKHPWPGWERVREEAREQRRLSGSD